MSSHRIEVKLLCDVCGEPIDHVDEGRVFFMNNEDGLADGSQPRIVHRADVRPGCDKQRDDKGHTLTWIYLTEYLDAVLKGIEYDPDGYRPPQIEGQLVL